MNAQLDYLQDLKEAPTSDTPTLKRVRQSRIYEVWRLSHPYRDGIAIRLIVWFPPDAPPVIVLFANDKAQMGDVFYHSVGSRADQVISAYLKETTETTMTDQPAKTQAAEFVGPDAAEARLAKLRTRHGAAPRVEKIRAEMAETDRLYAENLAAIRKAGDLTQVELARVMGVAQSEISRIESRPDMLLSTLASYLAAAGEHPRVVVTVAGHDIEIDLTSLTR